MRIGQEPFGFSASDTTAVLRCLWSESIISLPLLFSVFHCACDIHKSPKHVDVSKTCDVTSSCKVSCKHLVGWILPHLLLHHPSTHTLFLVAKNVSLKYGQWQNKELFDTSSFSVGVFYFCTYVPHYLKRVCFAWLGLLQEICLSQYVEGLK